MRLQALGPPDVQGLESLRPPQKKGPSAYYPLVAEKKLSAKGPHLCKRALVLLKY